MDRGCPQVQPGVRMPKTLLLADDSVTIQKVVGISFASEDVELVTVDNGDAAIERARALRPSLVMADVVMPGKNGYEVCEALKADPALRHIPVLLLTGTFEAFDEERARRCGAAGHISKPFEAQVLVQRVKQLLSQTPAAAPAVVPRAAATREPLAPAAPESDGFEFFDDEIAELSSPELAPARSDALRDDDFSFGDDELSSPLAPPTAPAAAPRARHPAAAPSVALAPPAAPKRDLAAASFEEDAWSTGSLAEPLPTISAELLDEEDGGFALPATSDSEFDFAAPADAPDLLAAEPESDDFGSAALPAAPAEGWAPREAGATQIFESPLRARAAAAPPPGPAGPGPGAARPARIPLGSGSPRSESATTALLGAEPQRSFDVSSSDLDDSFDSGLDASSAAAPDRERTRDDGFGDAFAGDLLGSRRAAPAASERRPTATAAGAPRATAGAARGFDAGAALAAPISSELRAQLHETLERAAWDAFGPLSEEIVKQVVERFEAIAWEVVPQLAEKMIRDVLQRVTAGEDDSEL